MKFPYYHLIIYVPASNAQAIRGVLADAGAGKMGSYDSCSFSVRGTGRFRPLEGADPAIGSVGSVEEVDEERIEVLVPNDLAKLRSILAAVKNAHPYEEPAMHLLPMMDYHSILETAYLFSSKKNFKHLKKSLREASRKKKRIVRPPRKF